MDKYYNLSQAQLRIMNTEKLYPGKAVNNLAGLFLFTREYDPELFFDAARLLVQSCDALRIRLAAGEDGWKQYVAVAAEDELKFESISFRSRLGNAGLDLWAERETRVTFQLDGGILFKIVPIALQSAEINAVYIKAHHVISDGWSLQMLAERLQAVCCALEAGSTADALAVAADSGYITHLHNEQRYLESDECYKDREWWLKQFDSPVENDQLSLSPATVSSVNAGRMVFQLPEKLLSGLGKLQRSQRCTLFNIVAGAVSIYIARAADIKEAVLSGVHHGRLTAADRAAVGMFVNTFLLRCAYDPAQSFSQMLLGQKKSLHDIFHGRQRYPYNKLFNELLKDGIIGSNFAPVNIVQIPSGRGDWSTEFIHNGCEASPLTIYIDPNGKLARGVLEFAYDYQLSAFDAGTIKQLHSRLEKLLDGIVSNPDLPAGLLPMLTAAEYELVRYEFNDNMTNYSCEETMVGLWEKAVNCYPGKAALVFGNKELTFSQTDKFACWLAGRLRGISAGRDKLVGILCERSLEMIPLALAVMRAGAAYLPIDPHYPDERIEYMLSDSEAAILLTQRSLDARTAGYCGVKIYCDDIIGEFLTAGAVDLFQRSCNFPEEEIPADCTAANSDILPADMAYMIYTSGSTGKPKGVMIEHRNLVNICLWHRDYHGITVADNTAFYSGFGFDASVWEIFPFLAAGVTVHVISDDIRLSPLAVNDYFNYHNITVANLPTQFCEQFMELCDNRSLRRLVTGGDKLNSFKKQRYTLVNEYGPTEYTISATAFEVEKFLANIPIGKPLANTDLYVVDANMQLVPVGVPGELCIAGRQLARGYWHRPDLTAEKFVDNPFFDDEQRGPEYKKMYRTGDRVRWLADGNIEFMGRIDFQVKIRGFRIELGEIEQALYALDFINAAVVLAIPDGSGEKALCAFAVVESGQQQPVVEALQQKLRSSLPDYMVPDYFVFMEELPLTANGKVDRRALPVPEFSGCGKNVYIEPVTERQKQLAQIWQSILNTELVGLDDNFFLLGGNSLRAGILQARIQKEYGVRIPLPEIFRFPVLREMASLFEGAVREDYQPIEHVSVSECALSETQSSMYAMLQLGDIGTAYNISIAYLVNGPMDYERFEQSVAEMIDRHDILRTVFSDENEVPVQRILPRGTVPFSLEYLPDSTGAQDANTAAARFVRPHNLAVAPLFRIGISRISETSRIMLVDFNHIIMDGSSMALFWQELGDIYAGNIPGKPALQYPDYVRWQQERVAVLEQQERYWLEKFRTEPEPLALPYDFPRPDTQNFEGCREFFSIDAVLHEKLQNCAARHGVSLYMLLLAALKCLLYRYSGQDDIVVGSVCAGRSHSDLEKIIGMFVNSLALRTMPSGGKKFSEYLTEVAAAVMEANDNQDYPFHSLAKKVVRRRDNSRNPLFDVMFVLQNTDAVDPVIDGTSVRMLNLNSAWSQVDITLEMEAQADGTLAGLVEYSTKLFKSASIKRMIGHYENILRDVTVAPERKLSEIVMLGADERKLLLDVYNATDMQEYKEDTVCERFRNIAARYPDNTALVYQEKSYSYKQLDVCTDYLATLLQQHDCGPETIAAIICGRNENMVLAELAALKSGAAFLPVDPNYPQERIEYMLEDSSAKLILCERIYADKISGCDCAVIWLDEVSYDNAASGIVPVVTELSAGSLCYVIYTSGSTGKPKGVMLEHGNLLNLCAWVASYHSVNERDCTAAYSGFGFDASVWEIYPFLLCGATVHIIPEAMKLLLPELDEYFSSNNVSIVNLPTQICEQYIEQFPESRLRTLVTGGDKLRLFEKRGYRLVNEYGPTEFTVSATAFCVDKYYENIPIGKPLGNCKAYILDRNAGLLPPGIPGELHLAGAQLARGYLNRPELTAEKFVVNPFAVAGDDEYLKKMYKTGDLARWNDAGEIEYLGRVDMQVKIRGFRIELGEIEQQLRKIAVIKDVAVFALDDNNGSKYICAWYVPQGVADVDFLRGELSAELPDYMIPSAWVEISAIPLNANGKIDRRALPLPDRSAAEAVMFEPPQGEVETAIATVWCELLDCVKIGRNDSFLSLGGDSIKAIQVVARLKRYDIAAEVKWLLKKPVLADFAATVKYGVNVVSNAPVSGDLPLTAIQTWFFNQDIPARQHWNQSTLYRAAGKVNYDLLEKAVALLVEHHDALRMVYRFDGNRIIQHNRTVNAENLYNIQRCSCIADDEQQLADEINARANVLQQSMDLEYGPLLQCCLFESRCCDYLAVIVHHLVVDDVSWQIISDDLNDAYQAFVCGKKPELPSKTDSYKKWAEKINAYAISPAASRDRRVWDYTDKQHIDRLPVRMAVAPSNIAADLFATEIRLDCKTTAEILECNAVYNTSTDELLLSAFSAALFNWSNGSIAKTAVTLESHGRQDIGLNIDISRTVGWFTAAFPLLLEAVPDDTGLQIKTIKERLRFLPSCGISYDVLHELAPQAGQPEKLPVEIEFAYHGDVSGTSENGKMFCVSGTGAGEDIAAEAENDYLWYVSAELQDGCLKFSLTANHYLFNVADMQGFGNCYQEALAAIVEHCRGRLPETTPSDYGCAGLGMTELESLKKQFDGNIADIMPLSPMQQGIFFEVQMDNATYVEQNIFSFSGELDEQRFNEHFEATMNRHDILKTAFVSAGDGQLWQVVKRKVYLSGNVVWQDYSEADGELETVLEKIAVSERARGVNLSQPPLVRMFFLRINENDYRIVYTTHHIITDGWSEGLLLQELLDGYYDSRFIPDTGSIVPYRRFIDWLGNQDETAARSFWSGYLAGIEERTEILPARSGVRGAAAEYSGYTMKLSADITKALKEVAARCQVTFGNVLMSMWSLLLMRYNNRPDVIFGYVDSGRRPEIDGVDRMLGITINTVPVRAQVGDDCSFSDFVRLMAADFNTAGAHNWMPLSEIQKLSPLREALISHLVVFQNLPEAAEDKVPYQLEELDGYDRVGFDFGLTIVPGEETGITISYNCTMYGPDDMQMIERNLLALSAEIIADSEKRAVVMSIMSPEEQTGVIIRSAGKFSEYQNKTILQLFDEAAGNYPDKLALSGCDRDYSFGELKAASMALGARLLELGLKPEQPVGVLVNRNSKILLAALAIMRAGGTYLPVDPAYPDERIAYMLEDSAATILITEEHLLAKTSEFKGTRLFADAGSYPENPAVRFESVLPQQLAYIIYTSGSTGKPKGVMIEHRSLVNVTQWIWEYYSLNCDDVMAAYSGFSFDASVWELFPFIAFGCTLHIVPENIRLSAQQLNEYFCERGVTITDLPTQFCEYFTEVITGTTLRSVTTGGDKLRFAKERSYNLVNEYGPTEFTISATAYTVESSAENIPIGKPLANSCAFVTDRWGNLQPEGIPGELCLSGIQLARGYLGRPELTVEKFSANPYARYFAAAPAGSSYSRMYHTGDLVRKLPDGNIEFLGRIDQQVKIRGFRIELGEIEQQLIAIDNINDAVVLALEDSTGGKYIAAYYTGAEYDAEEIRRKLAGVLPEYMLPAVFMRLDEIPVTANGKVDRRALPRDFVIAREQYVAPANDVESWLASLWSELLGIETVSVTENFFRLGGYSLKLAVMAGKIRQKFEVSLPLSVIYAQPTIRELAVQISGLRALNEPQLEIEHIQDCDCYPLSAAQKRMYILDGMSGAGLAYHITSALVIEGELNRDRFGRALEQVVERHEALRTSFELRDGEPVQVVHKSVKYKRTIRDAAAASDNAIARIVDDFVEDFDLDKAPLFKMELVRFSAQKYLFLFDIHHIIFDGLSSEVFMNELFELYSGKKLPLPEYQYRDFAVWQQRITATGQYEKMKQYWLRQFEGEIPVLNLPADFSRPLVRSFEGDNYEFGISGDLLDAVRTLSRQTNTTVFMLLLSAYYTLLSRYSRQEDIVVGIPGAGRIDSRLDNVIGMFVSTLALRAFPGGSKTFREFLLEVAENAMLAMDNQEYPLEALVDTLGLRRDSSRNPLFDVMFSYEKSTDSGSLSGLKITPWSGAEKTSQFDLTFEVYEDADKLSVNVEYASKLFRPDSIQRMAEHFVQILKSVTNDAEVKLAAINMITPDETEQVLNVFNATALTVPRNATAPQLFAQQAGKTPDRLAVVCGNCSYSYRELDEQSGKLAGILLENGAGPERIIAVMVNRSADIVVAGLAAMRTGAAFLPIDPGYPDERIQYMLEDSGAIILLTHTALFEKAAGFCGTILSMDSAEYSLALEKQQVLCAVNQDPANLAYVIYTSGSTGKPKGVMIEQRNLLNLCAWVQHYHGVEAGDRAATYSGFGFDASIWEMYPFLLYGNTLYVIPDELRLSPLELGRYLDENNISIINLPTQFCEQFMELADNRSLKTLVTGGDKLRTFFKRDYRLVNEYGPTEYTVSATAFTVDGLRENIPIGKPLANTAAYILDGYGNLQPVGVPGELCLAGAQLARGYLNRPELTAEKFVPNPFSKLQKGFESSGLNIARMYRSGDLARWLPDGNIEFLGRIDSQVKIRGYRIELGEIEQQMLAVQGVDDAVVIDFADNSGGRYLTGYYVSRSNSLTEQELRNKIVAELPEYMVPSHLLQLDEIPLTANGKIDRRALPKPQIAERSAHVAPQTGIEVAIAKVWKTVLGVEQPGLDDNFFEIGGNSIKAISVAAKLSSQYSITINDIFQNQTLRALAAAVKPVQNNLVAGLQKLKEQLQSEPDIVTADTPEIAAKRSAYEQLVGEIETREYRMTDWDAVLLTGATGYLGGYTLKKLYDSAADTQIYTIVRGKDTAAAAERLKEKLEWYFGTGQALSMLESGRISVLCGNLEEENLGLAGQEYEKLQKAVQAIIHTAANVRHFGKYEEFFASNVTAVKNLLAFAGTEIEFHHISTVSVAEGEIPDTAAALFVESDLDIGQKHDNVYLDTKYLAEKAVQQARIQGARANIYRVGNISVDSMSGKGQQNIEENAFFAKLKAYVNIGAAPLETSQEELSYVDCLADALLRIARCKTLLGMNFHLFNNSVIDIAEALSDKELDVNVKAFAMPDFIDHLIKYFDRPGFRVHIENILAHMDLLADEGTETEVASDWTTAILGKLDFVWPVPKPGDLLVLVNTALNERIKYIEKLPAFRNADNEALNLARIAEMRLYNNRNDVVWEGDPNDWFYIVLEGFASISRRSAGGWSGTVGMLRSSDFFGLESVTGNKRAGYTVEAELGELLTLAIPAAGLRNVLIKSPEITLTLMGQLQLRNEQYMRLLVNLS